MTTERADGATREASLVPPGRWRVDAERSRVGFAVRKMNLYDVKGEFRDVDGWIETGEAEGSVSGEVVIAAASVNTRMPPRDLHLRTSDFLGVKQHAQIRITTDRVEPAGAAFRVHATFEIRDARRPVELVAHRHDSGDGNARVHLQGQIERRDFGIKPMAPVAWIVGQAVNLDVELALVASG